LRQEGNGGEKREGLGEGGRGVGEKEEVEGNSALVVGGIDTPGHILYL